MPEFFLVHHFIFNLSNTIPCLLLSTAQILLCRNLGADPLCFITSVKSLSIILWSSLWQNVMAVFLHAHFIFQLPPCQRLGESVHQKFCMHCVAWCSHEYWKINRPHSFIWSVTSLSYSSQPRCFFLTAAVSCLLIEMP